MWKAAQSRDKHRRIGPDVRRHGGNTSTSKRQEANNHGKYTSTLACTTMCAHTHTHT